MNTAIAILMMTLTSGNGELSQRQQRMPLAECKAEIEAAKQSGGVVFAACVPVPAKKGSK